MPEGDGKRLERGKEIVLNGWSIVLFNIAVLPSYSHWRRST